MVRNEIKKFRMTAGEYKAIPCTVPFTLYSVLLENGYTESPLLGRNIEKAAALMPDCCSLVAEVELSLKEAKSEHVYLKLSGIHARAEVFFNGKNYGAVNDTNGIFYFDVTDMAEVGGNTLEIRANAPIPAKRAVSRDGKISDEFYTAPPLPDMGIVGSCELLSTSSAIIKEVRVSQKHEDGRVVLNIGVDTIGSSDDVRAMATLVSPTGKIYFGGISSGSGTVSIPDPELWWPNGLGNPLLYKLTVTLYKGELATDSYQCSVGLRTVAVERGEGGAPFLTVNGVRIFSMGATYVRENQILANINKKNTERLIKQAVGANMNTLRVVSEGVCPPDFFYDLCDKYGILVLQDVSVPYVAPPVAGVFAAGLTASLRDVIAKTTSHTSVALTYLSVTQSDGGAVPGSSDEIGEFIEVCSRILAPVIERYGNGRPYISDSFEFFSYDERYTGCGGASASLPDVKSLCEFAEGAESNPMSPTLELHSAKGAVPEMLSGLYRYFRFPSGADELVYASSLTAAYSAAQSVGRIRAAGGECGFAVCRQLNDTWPAVSASATDFFGRPKAFMYLAKDFFSPITVVAESEGAKMTFTVSNVSRKAYTGKLFYAIYSSDGTCIREARADAQVEAAGSAIIAEEDVSQYAEGSLSELYATYELSDQRGVTSSGVALLVPPKHYSYVPSEIKAEISGSGKKFTLKLSSASMCLGAHVSFGKIDATVSDNYVDLDGVSPVMLTVETKETVLVGELKAALRITHAFGLGN